MVLFPYLQDRTHQTKMAENSTSRRFRLQ